MVLRVGRTVAKVAGQKLFGLVVEDNRVSKVSCRLETIFVDTKSVDIYSIRMEWMLSQWTSYIRSRFSRYNRFRWGIPMYRHRFSFELFGSKLYI